MSKPSERWIPILLGILFVSGTLVNGAPERGIVGRAAPAWGVTQWHQLPEGKTSLDLADYKGKIVYLYCFQSWCPGCHSSGFPTLKKVSDHFAKDDAVVFAAVQTVFEGHSVNTVDKVKEIAEKYGLNMPMGHSGSKTERPPIMTGYRTGGTPWTIIIDAKGKVAFDGFHIQSAQAIELIEDLKGS